MTADTSSADKSKCRLMHQMLKRLPSIEHVIYCHSNLWTFPTSRAGACSNFRFRNESSTSSAGIMCKIREWCISSEWCWLNWPCHSQFACTLWVYGISVLIRFGANKCACLGHRLKMSILATVLSCVWACVVDICCTYERVWTCRHTVIWRYYACGK